MEDKKEVPTKPEKEQIQDEKQELNELEEEKDKLKRPHEKFYRVFRILGNSLFVPFVILIILCSILMYQSKIRNEVPSLFGYSAVKILSSSMEPRFSRGDVVLVKKIDINTLNVGDIIAFYEYYEEEVDENDLNNNALNVSMNTKTTIGSFLGAGTTNTAQQKAAKNYSRVIFHRIIEISSPTNPTDEYYGKKFFRTQGDNNDSPDEKWLMEDYVVGIGDETSKNTLVGKFFHFCTTLAGVIILVIIPALALIVIYVIDIIGETRKKQYQEIVEGINTRQSEVIDEIIDKNQRNKKLDEEQRRQQAILDEVLGGAARPLEQKAKPTIAPTGKQKPGIKSKPEPKAKPNIEAKQLAKAQIIEKYRQSEVKIAKQPAKPLSFNSSKPKLKPGPKPKFEPKLEPKVEANIEPKAKPQVVEPKVKPGPKPKLEPKPESQSMPKEIPTTKVEKDDDDD